MPKALASLSMVNLDSADPSGLAHFYAQALGWDVTYEDENYGMISDGGSVNIGFGRVESYRPTAWPDPDGAKRFHFDLQVSDLDEAKRELTALGAKEAEHQPQPDQWTVMLDPQGHPFCLVANPQGAAEV